MVPVVCVDFDFFSKTPLCVGRVVCEIFEFFSKTLPGVDHVVCGDFENVSKTSQCLGPVVCADFELFFQKLLYVWALWCVRTLNFCKNSSVCGPYSV